MHNLALVDVDGRTELSLHVKLPGELPLEEAHAIAEQLEARSARRCPRSPASRRTSSRWPRCAKAREVEADGAAVVKRVVRDATGAEPRELRFLRTTTASSRSSRSGSTARRSLDEAHARASEIEERIRRERPDIADVIVHTEP